MSVLYDRIGLWMCGIIFLIAAVEGEQHPATADEGPLSEVQTAVGLEVALPCDLMPGTMIADKVQLVIWYKQGSVKPIYTFDARGRALQMAIPWADETVFKKKAHFYYDSNPPALRIKNIQTTDGGLYKCRVDFNKSPTRNWRINVTVLVPPTRLVVLDHHGAAVQDDIVGPYLEGESINLTCLSSGGIPPPRISWWKEHALMDDSFQVLPDGTVRNILHLRSVGRRDLLTAYTCQASNGHVVAALSKTLKLDMILPPLSLLLQGLNHALVAGTRTHVTCSSIGARPPPRIVWTKGGQLLSGATQSTSSDSNTTISELVLIPVPEDNERQVVCSISLNPAAKSQQLREGHTTVTTTLNNGNIGLYLKDSRRLNVTHAPIVSLNLGGPLDPNNLMKGSDVYLECDVKANPAITRVEWYHNDKQLHSSRGLIISNQTLVLQAISKSSHGLYFCRATNIQGSVSSKEVYLDVKYPPVCMTESIGVIRAALRQTINITCQVDSNPLDNVIYKWHFNNSLESIVELPVATSPSILAASPLMVQTNSRQGAAFRLSTNGGFSSGGFHQRSKRKQVQVQQFGTMRQGRVTASDKGTDNGTWSHIRFEHDNDEDHDDYGDDYDLADLNGMKSSDDREIFGEHLNALANSGKFAIAAKDLPVTQMVYSNIIDNKLEKKQSGRKTYGQLIQFQQQQLMQNGGPALINTHSSVSPGVLENQLELHDRKRLAMLHKLQQQKQQHQQRAGRFVLVTSTPTSAVPMNNVYSYHIDTYDSFGAISCVASNAFGQSQPCWYHIQPADLPDPVKNCSACNATANSIQIQCIPGQDGGIPQYFYVQVYDELNRQIVCNTSYKYAEFIIKRLPSDSVFVVTITAVNAQGPSKGVYRLRARTLSAPLLRTASSTAVLVQLTPLLGAVVGVIATLILVAICIVIFIKFCEKKAHQRNSETRGTTEEDKGSAEPLSRNIGSHSSLEEKNPDVVPQETNSDDEFHLEEKSFDRLNMESQRIIFTPSKTRTSPTVLSQSRPLSPNFGSQYGELSVTTNPAFSLYNTTQRIAAPQRPVYNTPPPLLSTRTPANVYTHISGRSYLPAYDNRMSPTVTCTMPLLGGGQSNGSLQTNSSGGGGDRIVGSGVIGVGSSTDICNTLPHQASGNSIGIPGHIGSAQTPLLTSSMFIAGSVHFETGTP